MSPRRVAIVDLESAPPKSPSFGSSPRGESRPDTSFIGGNRVQKVATSPLTPSPSPLGDQEVQHTTNLPSSLSGQFTSGPSSKIDMVFYDPPVGGPASNAQQSHLPINPNLNRPLPPIPVVKIGSDRVTYSNIPDWNKEPPPEGELEDGRLKGSSDDSRSGSEDLSDNESAPNNDPGMNSNGNSQEELLPEQEARGIEGGEGRRKPAEGVTNRPVLTKSGRGRALPQFKPKKWEKVSVALTEPTSPRKGVVSGKYRSEPALTHQTSPRGDQPTSNSVEPGIVNPPDKPNEKNHLSRKITDRASRKITGGLSKLRSTSKKASDQIKRAIHSPRNNHGLGEVDHIALNSLEDQATKASNADLTDMVAAALARRIAWPEGLPLETNIKDQVNQFLTTALKDRFDKTRNISRESLSSELDRCVNLLNKFFELLPFIQSDLETLADDSEDGGRKFYSAVFSDFLRFVKANPVSTCKDERLSIQACAGMLGLLTLSKIAKNSPKTLDNEDFRSCVFDEILRSFTGSGEIHPSDWKDKSDHFANQFASIKAAASHLSASFLNYAIEEIPQYYTNPVQTFRQDSPATKIMKTIDRLTQARSELLSSLLETTVKGVVEDLNKESLLVSRDVVDGVKILSPEVGRKVFGGVKALLIGLRENADKLYSKEYVTLVEQARSVVKNDARGTEQQKESVLKKIILNSYFLRAVFPELNIVAKDLVGDNGSSDKTIPDLIVTSSLKLLNVGDSSALDKLFDVDALGLSQEEKNQIDRLLTALVDPELFSANLPQSNG